MKKLFAGISTIIVIFFVIVIVVVIASALYLIPSGKSTSSSNPATDQSQQFARATTNSSSSSSSNSSTALSSSSKFSGQLLMEFTFPGTLVASPDISSINYSINFDAIGSVPNNIGLSVVVPSGLTANVSPSNVTLGENPTFATLQIGSSQTTTPGNYQFTLVASGNGSTYKQNETVQVLKYLVVTIGANFVPKNLTVAEGGTVTWLRLNGVLSQYDSGAHDVDFSSGISVVSPTLDQYQSWTYTFSQPGNYSYYCKYHPFMTGEIAVVPSN